MAEKVIPLIIAGGNGSRFWPLSRAAKPKQFLAIGGKTSLLERTLLRAEKIAVNSVPYIVAGADQYPLVYDALREKEGAYRFIGEPTGKNTAAAIYWACSCIRQTEGDGVIVVLPADHYIGDVVAFANSIERAAAAAEKKRSIVLLGVRPKNPAVGYGYVERGRKERDGNSRFYEVRRFVEKPCREKAKHYLKQGNYFWNSGIFVFPLSEIFSVYQRCLPEMVRSFEQVSPGEEGSLESVYDSIENISFDYGILERQKSLYLVPADFDWDDVGSFSHLSALIPPDHSGNVVQGNCVFQNVSDSVVLSDNRFTAVIGLKDIVIVEDRGVLLVCHRRHTEEIRRLVEILNSEDPSLL